MDDVTVGRLLTHKDLVEALTAAHIDHHQRRITQPAPAVLPIPQLDGGAKPAPHHVVMSAASADLTLVKVLLDAPARRDRAEPAQRSVISVYDTSTGDCLSVVDGRTITRMRTAAATIVAVQALSARADVLGVIGAGALAAEHVRCAVEVLGVSEVVLWSRRDDAVAALGSVVASAGARWRAAPSPVAVARAADAVVTVTPATEPLLDAGDLCPGVHVSAVGSPPRPGYRELSAAALAQADLVVVDDAAIARRESAQIRAAVDEGMSPDELVEIGAVLAGESPGRTRPEQITVHSSIGVAFQDLAAVRTLRAALAGGALR